VFSIKITSVIFTPRFLIRTGPRNIKIYDIDHRNYIVFNIQHKFDLSFREYKVQISSPSIVFQWIGIPLFILRYMFYSITFLLSVIITVVI
jgi:hypothetical protein